MGVGGGDLERVVAGLELLGVGQATREAHLVGALVGAEGQLASGARARTARLVPVLRALRDAPATDLASVGLLGEVSVAVAGSFSANEKLVPTGGFRLALMWGSALFSRQVLAVSLAPLTLGGSELGAMTV